MDVKYFDEQVLEPTLESSRLVLSAKAREYSTHDRLHNFKRASVILQTTVPQSVISFATKHLVSLLDIVFGNIPFTKELLDEKIGDLINYLILLKAVIYEEKEW